jgi:purine-binding chemotaxis protein CheW
MNEKDQQPHEGEARSRRAATHREEDKVIQLIVFKLADEEFGADIDQVREIIRRTVITPIPDSPDFIKGVTNVRGEIAVVINLKSRFFLPAREGLEERHIVMTEQEKNLFGLMVDEVTEVLRMPRGAIKTTPELVTRIDRVYISGVITINNRLIMLLDLAKVLSEAELKKLSEVGARRRQLMGHAKEKAEQEHEEEMASETSVEAESAKAPAGFGAPSGKGGPKRAKRKKQERHGSTVQG